MASATHHVSQTRRFAENVVLLDMLTPLPEAISIRKSPKLEPEPDPGGTRRLSFAQELALATTLAFLSSITEDKNLITAVCVEEVPLQNGCKVIVAVNKACESDGQDVLCRLQKRFDQIFGRLRQISAGESPQMRLTARSAPETCLSEQTRYESMHVRTEVFNDIVALCREHSKMTILPSVKRCHVAFA